MPAPLSHAWRCRTWALFQRGHHPTAMAQQRRLAGRNYFCGDFSVADIGLFMTVLFVLRRKGPRLDGHPELAAWYARVGARAAVAPVAAEIAAADRALTPALHSAPTQ